MQKEIALKSDEKTIATSGALKLAGEESADKDMTLKDLDQSNMMVSDENSEPKDSSGLAPAAIAGGAAVAGLAVLAAAADDSDHDSDGSLDSQGNEKSKGAS